MEDPQIHTLVLEGAMIFQRTRRRFQKQLEASTFWRLNKLTVMRRGHFLLQLCQYILHCVLSLPVCKYSEFLRIHLYTGIKSYRASKGTRQRMEGRWWFYTYHSCFVVDTSHVNTWMESDSWRFLRVIFVTKELQLINSTFMNSLWHKIDTCYYKQKQQWPNLLKKLKRLNVDKIHP